MARQNQVRPPGVAGLFYPSDKVALERELSLMLENSPRLDLPRPVRGSIVPHAGIVYSGGVAARAYRQLIGIDYEVIAVVALSHVEQYPMATVYPGRALQTPLGEVPLDTALAREITTRYPQIRLSIQGYASDEHSLEVQLPFIQWVQPNTPILPLMMGEQSPEAIDLLTEALTNILKGRNFLIIGTTDLSHYYPSVYARALDQVAINDVERFSPERLLEDIREQRCEMCSYGAALVAMRVAKAAGAQDARVLLYRNSGDISGDHSRVVGYLAAIFY
ncbi:MAG: AmmeMemoRadiSam system protein B [Calditrichaeota bacterium]|nr:MAG: AmmeMemoRadiSam system protein B [Calditrichota bacterium]